jgi:hypothetical protein
MELIDQAGEWRRLAEHYRQMTDEELLALARQISALTEGAQDALKQEISNRRLKVPSGEPSSQPEPPPDVPEADDPYAKDRELVEVATVWSLRDAQKLQYVLDVAGIPFYMGPQKATRVDPATMNFSNGVVVKIMRVGWPWAWQAMRNYFPADEPPEEKLDIHGEDFKVEVRCPKCHSTDVIFERLVSEPTNEDARPPSKFNWTCDSCGYEWEDDGVAKY